MLLQQLQHGVHLGALGNGADDVAGGVEHRQPHAHAVGHGGHKAGVHLVVFELADHLRPFGGVVHHAHKAGAQFHIGDILHHVAANAAVDDLHRAGVAPGGDILVVGKALDVHKYVADDDDRHRSILLVSERERSSGFRRFVYQRYGSSRPASNRGRGKPCSGPRSGDRPS